MAYTSVDDPTIYFDTTLYTGNGSSQTLTMDNIGLLWMKRRDSSIRHCLFDSVRGGHYTGSGNAPLLVSDGSAAAQGTDIDSAAKGVTFGATQTVIGNDAAGYSYNVSGHSMVGWQWQAGGSGSSNTNGSINSTVSVNTAAGFSVCSWTHDGGDSTIGHGLGAIPQVIITKELNNSGSWNSYFNAVGNGYRMVLQGTNAKISSSIWDSTTPTANVFSMNDSITSTMIAYCFAEKKGYSKFGSYVGNSSTDGSFIYTGFRPAFIITKASTTGQSWQLYDTKRNPFNQSNKVLFPNQNYAEQDDSSAAAIDILSNGFKQRVNDAGGNSDSHTYIYMAFAEAPFVNSNGVPTTAR